MTSSRVKETKHEVKRAYLPGSDILLKNKSKAKIITV